MKEDIKKTRDLAVQLHKNQLYNTHNYSYHLDQVYALICEAGLGDDFKIGAYLHDTLEDTTLTYDNIVQNYDKHIADMVFTVSGFGANRKQRHEDMKNKLIQNIEFVDLKMADRIVNMRNCVLSNNQKLLKTYLKEMDSFKEVFSHGSNFFKDIFETEFNYPIKNKNKPSI